MFEIRDITSSDNTDSTKRINGAALRKVDEDGNPVSDKCGRPVYVAANIPSTILSRRIMYIIDDGVKIRLMTSKSLKSLYGARQVKKAIRRFRARNAAVVTQD